MQKKIISVILLGVGVGVVYYLPHKPEMKILSIPFTTQAPTGLWAGNLDCEEASLAMVKSFFDGNNTEKVETQTALDQIQKLNDWEKENLGHNQDTGADDTAKMAEDVLNLKTKIVTDFSVDDLQKALAKGNSILLPLNAGLLNNPKYQRQGDFYHMIVIKGYHDDKFIVHDPGTESGANNEYTFETLKNAAADWDQSSHSMNPNRKVILVLSK